jgi:hypothetical protein
MTSALNKQMHRTAAARSSFLSAGLFRRWIRSPRSFPATVGDLGRWHAKPMNPTARWNNDNRP